MRTNQNFGILYILMLICQIVICNFSPLGPYIVLTTLPAMVLCIPLTVSIAGCTDVVASRAGVVEDLINRSDSFSFNKYGTGKISAALLTSLTIFLAFYIILDGAGTRPSLVNLSYFGASLVCNWILSLLVTKILTPDDRK